MKIDRSAVPPVPEETPVRQYFGDRATFESFAYNGVVPHLVKMNSLTLIADRTIRPPEGATSNLETVRKSIVDDFEDINRQSAKVNAAFDVYATLKAISAKATVSDTLEYVRRTFPKADAVIYISRAGLSPTADTKLVYVERYELSNKVSKGFCFTLPRGQSQWFDAEGKIIKHPYE